MNCPLNFTPTLELPTGLFLHWLPQASIAWGPDPREDIGADGSGRGLWGEVTL